METEGFDTSFRHNYYFKGVFIIAIGFKGKANKWSDSARYTKSLIQLNKITYLFLVFQKCNLLKNMIFTISDTKVRTCAGRQTPISSGINVNVEDDEPFHSYDFVTLSACI